MVFKTYLILLSYLPLYLLVVSQGRTKAKVEKPARTLRKRQSNSWRKRWVTALSGSKAHNTLEKTAASAQDVNGIKSVVNNVLPCKHQWLKPPIGSE